jgi:hypothetical protein
MTLVSVTQVARSLPFDNETNGFVSTDVQAAIEEISVTGGVSASPGFTWGGSGTITKGSYLQNDTVPSNVSGRMVPLVSGILNKIFVACEIAATFKVNVMRRSGSSFTTIATVSMVNQRVDVFNVSVAVALNDELAMRIDPTSTDNPRNVVVGVVIKGVTT